jgi:hypothetical protein
MIFDDFLTAGLIPIGGDDQVYNKLIKASTNLEGILKKDKAKVINYTLVALDSNITEREPVLAEVEEVVTQEWKLIRSQFTNMPIAIYRGIILQALENLGTNDSLFAAIIWHSGCDIFTLYSKKAKESEILSTFLNKMGDLAEEAAIKEWSIDGEPKGIRLPAFQLDIKILDSKVDITELTECFIAASGPNGEDGVARNDSNPYWPSKSDRYDSQNPNWSYQFAPRAAKGITNSVNKAFVSSNQNMKNFIDAFQKNANDYFSKLKTDVSAAIKETIRNSIAVERRSQLLWWKETLYSRTLKKSYRDLDDLGNAVAMAFDLKNLLPTISPVSVMYVLKETFHLVNGKKKRVKISEIVTLLKQKERKYLLENYFVRMDINSRSDIVSYLNEVLYDSSNFEEQILFKLGVKSDMEVEYDFLSTWILNSLIAQSLIK